MNDNKLFNLNWQDVIKGQGADPEIIASRKPVLVDIATHAIEIGLPLIKRGALTHKLTCFVDSNGMIMIGGYKFLGNSILTNALAGSESVIVGVITIGERLEYHASEVFSDDPLLSLALDGLANAALEQLREQIWSEVEQEAIADGLKCTLPIGPGSETWPLGIGQPIIFNILKPDPQFVRLNESFLMIPKKSTSFIIGLGKTVDHHGKSCDECSARDTCRYKARKLL
jgi:hypothetical protein